MCAELEKRGYVIAETTRVMGMGLEHLSRLDGADRLAPASWQEYLEYLHALDLPRGLLAGVDPDAYRVLAARLDGENVATGLAFDHEDDCAIFNLSTLEVARRRGFGTAITVGLLRDARARGCSTATLQATPIAEGIYASVGFRDLGQFLEFAPSHSGNRSGLP
jgi:ribosomal protein S18 acetylase RimI-like enzyme